MLVPESSWSVDPDGLFRCDAFRQFTWLTHAFGSRYNNPSGCITLCQIHSNRVWNAAGLADREREGDALITNQAGTAIGVRTADCVPILLADPDHRAVAAVHAGWRGTGGGIIERAIEKLREDFGSHPRDIYAAIGPCIRGCCYEVGAEVADRLASLFPEWRPTLDGRQYVDLAEANRRQMEAARVEPERVFDCSLCTACLADRFFSYRREPLNPGRMLSSISIVEANV